MRYTNLERAQYDALASIVIQVDGGTYPAAPGVIIQLLVGAPRSGVLQLI